MLAASVESAASAVEHRSELSGEVDPAPHIIDDMPSSAAHSAESTVPSSAVGSPSKPPVATDRVPTRKCLSFAEKADIIRRYETDAISHRDLSELFDVDRSTITKIIRARDKILPHAADNKLKRLRKGNYHDVEDVTYQWITEKINAGEKLTRSDVQCKALQIGQELQHPSFHASQTWLEKFLRRRHLNAAVLRGDVPMPVLPPTITNILPNGTTRHAGDSGSASDMLSTGEMAHAMDFPLMLLRGHHMSNGDGSAMPDTFIDHQAQLHHAMQQISALHHHYESASSAGGHDGVSSMATASDIGVSAGRNCDDAAGAQQHASIAVDGASISATGRKARRGKGTPVSLGRQAVSKLAAASLHNGEEALPPIAQQSPSQDPSSSSVSGSHTAGDHEFQVYLYNDMQ